MPESALANARISLASPLVAEPKATGADASVPSFGLDTEWDRVFDELQRLRGLQDDWDGQGAQAPDPANVDQAIAWTAEMRRWHHALPPTKVMPGTLSEVVLEWRGDGYHLAAEISEPARVEWLLNLPGQPIKQWVTDASRPWIVRADY